MSGIYAISILAVTLLARCREEEPRSRFVCPKRRCLQLRVALRATSMRVAHGGGGDDVTEPLWHDLCWWSPVPAWHPFCFIKAVPLHQLCESCPLVLCDPQTEGRYRELTRLLRPLSVEPRRCRACVLAGYDAQFRSVLATALASSAATRVAGEPAPRWVIRPLAMDSAIITTLLAAARQRGFAGIGEETIAMPARARAIDAAA